MFQTVAFSQGKLANNQNAWCIQIFSWCIPIFLFHFPAEAASQFLKKLADLFILTPWQTTPLAVLFVPRNLHPRHFHNQEVHKSWFLAHQFHLRSENKAKDASFEHKIFTKFKSNTGNLAVIIKLTKKITTKLFITLLFMWSSSAGVSVSALPITGTMFTLSCSCFINSMSRGFSLECKIIQRKDELSND